MIHKEFVLGNVILHILKFQIIMSVHNVMKMNFHYIQHNVMKMNFHYIQQDKINHNVSHLHHVHKVIVVIKYK